MLPKFQIGTLVSREFTPYKRDESGFYRDMCQRVGKVSLRVRPPVSLLLLDMMSVGHGL